MNFWRAILASLLSLVCTVAVSTYVTLQTLESTVLNRDEVKSWLDKSGVYNNLLSTFTSANQTAQEELNMGGSVVSSDNLKAGLNQTFTPSYVQQATEKAIDGTYDWLDGTASTINFSIDTTTKKSDFITNLSSVLQPQLAALPRCTSLAQFDSTNPTCLPPGTTAKQAADELATDAANKASIFHEPVSNQTVAQTSSSPNNSLTDNQGAQQTRALVSNLKMWLLWLPIIAVVSGGLMVLLSQHKLKAGKHLAGKLTWGLGITFVVGLLIANVGRTFAVSNYASGGTSSTVLTNIVEPIIHQAAPAIGNRLALVSGILGAVTLAIWITLLVIKKRKEKAELLAAPKEEVLATKPSQPVNEAKPAEAGPTEPTKTPASKP